MKDSISIVIAAYNEEENIQDSLTIAAKIVSKEVHDFEIIIVNDGSTDSTGTIADRIAKGNTHVKVIHHEQNEGFGVSFFDGIQKSTKFYVTGYPGDNDWWIKTFSNLLKARRNNYIVSQFMRSLSDRELSRQCISLFFTKFLNTAFKLHIKYYNGYFICPADMVKPLPIISRGFTLFAEIKIRLIKQGIRIKEIPFTYKARQHGVSKAVTKKSIVQTITFLIKFLFEMYFSAS